MNKKIFRLFFLMGGVILFLVSCWAINPVVFRPAEYNNGTAPIVPFAILIPKIVEEVCRVVIFYLDLLWISGLLWLWSKENSRLYVCIFLMLFTLASIPFLMSPTVLDTQNPYNGYAYEHTAQWQAQGKELEIEGFLSEYAQATSYRQDEMRQQIPDHFVTLGVTVYDIEADSSLEYGYAANLTGVTSFGKDDEIVLWFPVSKAAATDLKKGQKIIVRGKIENTLFLPQNDHTGDLYRFELRGATITLPANDGASLQPVY